MKLFKYSNYELEDLLRTKRRKGLTVGLCIPTLNEGRYIGRTINVIRSCSDLFDEVIVIDSGSTDSTKKVCQKKNVKFYLDKEIAKETGNKLFRGKGYNLWLSLLVLKTDVVIWMDADIINLNTDFLIGLAGPFIKNENIKFLKGYYKKSNGGGRVTELLVRPFLNLIFPNLSNIIQPLSGEYGGERDFLSKLFFYSGFSVEIALLIQCSYLLNGSQIGQIYLGEKDHESRDLNNISICSASILKSLLEISSYYGVISCNSINSVYKYYINEENIIVKTKLEEKRLAPHYH
jgi:glucosyl-3-phosphoglycerate synthase